MDREEIIFTGLGGQGIVKSGIILAEAAVIQGKHVVQMQNYGPESRGGSCRSDVIISEEKVSYPVVEKPSILLALSQSGFDKYMETCNENTIIITDKSIDTRGFKNVRKFDIFDCVENQIKNLQAINILCLGILSKIIKDIDKDALKEAIADNVPKSTIDSNLIAFSKGIELEEAC